MFFRYNAENLYNNIAVIKLNEAVGSNRVLPLCNTSFRTSKDHKLAAVGMGVTTFKPKKQYASVLQEVQLTETLNSCLFSFNKYKQACVETPFKDFVKGTCSGDYGGPVFVMTKDTHRPVCLYGIISYTNSGCNDDTVLTRVPSYINWVNQKIHYFDSSA